jgi:hypothetical protein
MKKIDGSVDEKEELLHANPELLHAPNNSHDNCCKDWNVRPGG